jgi:hypothetical protein
MTEPTQQSAETSLQGQEPSINTSVELAAAIDRAFDYRGDVTIHTAQGQVIEGYIFDRRAQTDPPHLRIIPKGSDQMVDVNYADVTKLTFSGKDTAAGKSWETWVKQHQEKKQLGESASLHPEELK